MPRPHYLFPFQSPFLPYIEITDKEDDYKNQHFHKTEHLETARYHCPGIEEHDFYIEDKKKHGHDIVADVHFHPRGSDGLHAAFIGGKFGFFINSVAENMGSADDETGDQDGKAHHDKDRGVFNHAS